MAVQPKFAGTVEFPVLRPKNKDAFMRHLRALNGEEVEFSISRRKKLRSDNQNSYYWGVVIDVLAGELGYTPDEMHEALKVKFLMQNEKKLPVPKSTTQLSTRDFEQYMEQVRRWAAMELGLVIPEPNQVDV